MKTLLLFIVSLLAISCGGNPCSPETCNGCCMGSECEPGLAVSRCGSGGQTCSICDGTTQTCGPNVDRLNVCLVKP